MKLIITSLLFILTFGHVQAQSISKADSLEIIKKIDDWNRSWSTKDYSMAARWYADDADFTNAFGFNIIGREALEEYLMGVFKLDFVMAGNTRQASVKMKPIGDDAILVISTVERTGQKSSNYEELGVRHTTHHRIFENLDGWYITAHLVSDARSTGKKDH